MNIFLMRHGRQNSTLCNVNVELSEQGRMQADLLGKRLNNYNIDTLYSSDLTRAVETAEIANRYLRLEHKIREDLREISFGDLEGFSDEYINENFADFKKERAELTSDLPFPNGESGQDVFLRANRVIDEIRMSQAKNIAVVTHGGTIRSLLAGLLGMDQSKKLLFAVSLENCSITQLVYKEEEQRFYLERFNDFSHLEQDEQLLRKHFK